MELDRTKYNKEFQSFLENVYRQDGPEGIANCMPFVVGAFVVTLDGYIVAANNNFLNLVGYKKEELYKKKAITVVYYDDRNMVINRLKEENQQPYLLRLISKDHQIKYVNASPFYFAIDGIKYRLSEFLDNSEAMALQKQKINALKKTAMAISNTIEKRDPYTHGHMYRTSLIASEIAKLLHLDNEQIDSIQLGASIHDIGKINIPTEILIKPSKLEKYEWEFIKTHPEQGYQILKDIDFVGIVKNIIFMHHEHQDGSGYPSGLTKDDIPIEVAVVSVADSLEAISGARPYRRANTFENAIEIMNQESHLYHPEALETAAVLVRSGKLTGREFGLN